MRIFFFKVTSKLTGTEIIFASIWKRYNKESFFFISPSVSFLIPLISFSHLLTHFQQWLFKVTSAGNTLTRLWLQRKTPFETFTSMAIFSVLSLFYFVSKLFSQTLDRCNLRYHHVLGNDSDNMVQRTPYGDCSITRRWK